MFNTSVDDLKKLNNLSGNALSIGQIIKINSIANDMPNTYTVQRGDTLYSIARTFNTDIATLRNLNNLVNNILTIGQTIKIR